MLKISIVLAVLIKLVNGLNVPTYTVHPLQKSWSYASKICQSEGKQLLTIPGKDIFQFLSDSNDKPPFNGIFFGNKSKEIWTGLSTNLSKCESYTWNDDKPLGQWTNWDEFEPNFCSTDKCIRMVKLKWRTINCTKTYSFICESVSQQTSTVDVPTTRTVVMPTTRTVVMTTTRTVVMTTATTASTSCSEICSRLSTDLSNTVCSEVSRELNNTLDSKDLEKEIKKLKEELTVTKTTTQMYVRSKISVYEERTSAKTMGIVGITVIAVLIGLVVIPDVVTLIHFVIKKLH